MDLHHTTPLPVLAASIILTDVLRACRLLLAEAFWISLHSKTHQVVWHPPETAVRPFGADSCLALPSQHQHRAQWVFTDAPDTSSPWLGCRTTVLTAPREAYSR